MKKLPILTLSLISMWIVSAVSAVPVIVPTSIRDLPNDAFSPTSSITILGSSTVAAGSALNLFGGTGGVEGDDALFADASIGTTYFVNWQTSAPVTLSSYRVVLTDDEPSNNRAISQVRLYWSADASFASPVLLSTVGISSPYGSFYGGAGIEVRDRFPATTAQFFRLEFVNASVAGPRIVEVDGNVDQTSPTTDGVFLRTGGVLTKIALAGETISGVGTLSRDFDGPALNNNSTVAFSARGIVGGPVTGAVFIKKTSGALTALVKTGDPAPVPGGGIFATNVGIPFDDLVLNNNDDVAFIAIYTQDGGSTFKMGVFLKPDGQPLSAILLNGDVLPGTGGGIFCGTTFGDDPLAPPVSDNGSVDGPWMNDIRTVVFKADAICGGSGALGESAFVKRSGMPIEQAVLIGEAGPGVAGGVIESIEPGRPGINNLNTFAFHSTVTAGATNTEIIYTRTVGVSPLLPPIVRVKAGDAAPRTSGTFTSLSAPGINQTGSLIFHADITGDPSVRQGIFYSVGGITGAIAIEGDTMPGTNGQTFCNNIEEGSLSDDARFVFMNESFLEGPLCSPFGVFATSPLPPPPPGVVRPGGVVPLTITPVALEGDLAPGTIGGVFGFACIRGTCGSDGTTVFDEPSINTSGDVVFIGGVILPPRPQLRNISTRGVVMDGDKVLIGGFMLRGVDSKSVLIRGLGPSLSVNGVPLANRMANPTIKLMQGSTELAQNNDWRSDQQTEIAATGLPPEFDTEAALVRTLAPGDYSVILGGADNTTGLGLVEIYDLDYSRLAAFANISTRGLVEPGDHALIGGIIIQPPANPPANLPQVMPSTVRVIVRAIGPSMNVNGQPVPGRLADPTLDLYDANGSTLFSNDDWVNSLQMSEIIASGLAPTDPKESAIIGNFAPGSFTAVVRGAGGTSGIALVEAYELNPPSFSR